MTILGCNCLNILIHIDKVLVKEDPGLLQVKLTLDGINIQQSFLVDETKQGDWVLVSCKVCDTVFVKCDSVTKYYRGST